MTRGADSAPRADNILVTLTINPPPVRAADEFELTAASTTEGYSVDPPVIVGQHPTNGGQLLTVRLRVYPTPLTPSRSAEMVWRGNRYTTRQTPVEHLSETPPPAGQGDVGRDPTRRPVNILITMTFDPTAIRPADGIVMTATSATKGYSVDEPSIMGSFACKGGRSVTAHIRIYPSPPPAPPPPVIPWWILDPNPTAFAQAIRSARERAGLSKAELSRRTGVTEMTIRNVENLAAPCSPKTRDALIAVLTAAGQTIAPPPPKEEPPE